MRKAKEEENDDFFFVCCVAAASPALLCFFHISRGEEKKNTSMRTFESTSGELNCFAYGMEDWEMIDDDDGLDRPRERAGPKPSDDGGNRIVREEEKNTKMLSER